MDRRSKGNFIGILGTVLVHLLLIALLILVSFAVPQPDEDAGGVPVMMGEVESAKGWEDPSLVDVDVLDEVPQEVQPEVVEPEIPSEQDLLTQAEEETVAMKPKTEPKPKVEKKKEPVKQQPKEPVKKPEKTEAEKAAEAKRLAQEKAERERKAAEEKAKRNVASAFGKGAQMGTNKGTADKGAGVQGSVSGNAATGANQGSAGYGSFDLGGRSLGEGGLPKPAYTVQEEGRVVVTIWVNPAGRVIRTAIHPRTNTVSAALRKSAEEAARKARFNAVQGVNHQQGTITYNFNLK